MPRKRSRRKKKVAATATAATAIDGKALKTLLTMGFDMKASRLALLRTGDDLALATQILLPTNDPSKHAPKHDEAVAVHRSPSPSDVLDDLVPGATSVSTSRMADNGWVVKSRREKKKRAGLPALASMPGSVRWADAEELARRNAHFEALAGAGTADGTAATDLDDNETENLIDEPFEAAKRQWSSERAELQAQIDTQARQIQNMTWKLSVDNSLILSALAVDAESAGPQPTTHDAEVKAAVQQYGKKLHGEFCSQLKIYLAEKKKLEARNSKLEAENAQVKQLLALGQEAAMAELLRKSLESTDTIAALHIENSRLKALLMPK